MRIATMYTGAGAMDYGYVRARARDDDDDDANANFDAPREGKSATSFHDRTTDRLARVRAPPPPPRDECARSDGDHTRVPA